MLGWLMDVDQVLPYTEGLRNPLIESRMGGRKLKSKIWKGRGEVLDLRWDTTMDDALKKVLEAAKVGVIGQG